MLQEAGSRPLIFSQWTMVLDILEWLLQCLKLPYVRLDGATAVADRLTIVDMYGLCTALHKLYHKLKLLPISSLRLGRT